MITDTLSYSFPERTVASRFYRWRKAGVFQHLFDTLKPQADAAGQLDWEVHFVDSPILRAHQHAAGGKGDAETEALGRSQGGFSTQVHRRAEGAGKLLPRC
jgi:transposase